jgi:hypothetical protein
VSKCVESVPEHFVSQSGLELEKVSKSVEVGFAVLLEGATTELRLERFAVHVDLASEKSFPGKQKRTRAPLPFGWENRHTSPVYSRAYHDGISYVKNKRSFITLGRVRLVSD